MKTISFKTALALCENCEMFVAGNHVNQIEFYDFKMKVLHGRDHSRIEETFFAANNLEVECEGAAIYLLNSVNYKVKFNLFRPFDTEVFAS